MRMLSAHSMWQVLYQSFKTWPLCGEHAPPSNARLSKQHRRNVLAQAPNHLLLLYVNIVEMFARRWLHSQNSSVRRQATVQGRQRRE